jgi:hypothetical protein
MKSLTKITLVVFVLLLLQIDSFAIGYPHSVMGSRKPKSGIKKETVKQVVSEKIETATQNAGVKLLKYVFSVAKK